MAWVKVKFDGQARLFLSLVAAAAACVHTAEEPRSVLCSSRRRLRAVRIGGGEKSRLSQGYSQRLGRSDSAGLLLKHGLLVGSDVAA